MTRIFESSKVFWMLGLPSIVFLIASLVIWFGVGSRLLINPTGIKITPCGDVVMHRNYPMVDRFGWEFPLVSYVTTITPLTPETNNGYACREDNGRGQRYNHDHDRGFGKWAVNHYAQECMQDPVGWVFHTVYTAYFLDMIPLRPISITATVVSANDSRWMLCPFRRPEL